MKVLIVIDSLTLGGGIQQSVVTLCSRLKDKGVECNIAVLFPRKDSDVNIENKKIRIFFLNLKSRWDFIGSISNLSKVYKNYRFDIIHAHSFMAQIHVGIGRIFFKKSKLIATHHDLKYEVYPAKKLLSKLLKIFHVFINRYFFDKHTAVSETVKEYICSYYRIPSATVIPNGFDINYIRMVTSKSHFQSNRKHYLGNKFKFLAVIPGRLVKEKNHKIILKTINEYPQKLSRILFLIVGNGEMGDELKKCIEEKKLENVRILQAMKHDSLLFLMKESDLIILPSLSEGFPLVIGEAMALGKTIVSTKISSISEILIDECDSLLVDPKDPSQLYCAISEILSNKSLRCHLSFCAKKNIEKFDIDIISDRWIDFYKIQIGGARRQ